jgi:Cu2+-exporting ATPase
MWLARPGKAPVRFCFDERPRADAAAAIGRLRSMGLALHLISGDRTEQVQRIAAMLDIDDWKAGARRWIR